MFNKLRVYKAKIKETASFPEESFAFGVPMPGAVKRDLYIFIFAVVFGIFFGVITGFPNSSPLFSAFLKEELKVSNSLYGFMVALPYFTVILQIPFAAFLRRRPKIKNFYIGFSLITRLNFILIGILSYILKDHDRQVLTVIVLLIQAVTSVFWWISDLCFSLWSGHVCPEACNGRFFSTRQMFFTAAQLVYSFVLTILLRILGDRPEKYLILFSIAGIFGCIEILSFIKVRRPDIRVPQAGSPKKNKHDSPLAPFRDRNYRNFLFFSTLWYFGVFLQSPFTNVYMNEALRIPLSRQTLYSSFLPGLATVIFIRIFGRMSDRYGFRNCILLFANLAALSSLFWLFVTPETEWLIIVTNFSWGIVGTATDLAIFSMGIYLAPSEGRSSYISVKTVMVNLFGIALSILLGGIIMDKLSPVLEKAALPFLPGRTLLPFQVITLTAVFLRLVSLLVFARRLDQDSELEFRDFLKKFGASLSFRFRLRTGLINRRRK